MSALVVVGNGRGAAGEGLGGKVMVVSCSSSVLTTLYVGFALGRADDLLTAVKKANSLFFFSVFAWLNL